MGVSYIAFSAACTVLSFIGLQLWTELSIDNLRSEKIIGENPFQTENAGRVIDLLLSSYVTVGLLANFALNVFVLLMLFLKTIFFVELYSSESRKLVERLVNYIIYKGTFLPLVVPPTKYHAALWSIWLAVLCSLKMFQALARDRLERLNASPSATSWTYFRVYSVLLLVLFVDLSGIRFCLMIYRTLGLPLFLLLFFEPLSIAFETLQAILVHGFQLLDIWLHHSAENCSNCQISKFFNMTIAGSLWELKGSLIRNLGFFLDMATLLMALGHYVHIWRLHGMTFNLVDAVLFLHIRALLSAIIKRIRVFMKLMKALGALHAALPDATPEELQAYDDECAICREPMAKAKKLNCNHLFHLACLRSWLDQGLNEYYSCPTCRKPLFVGRQENDVNPHAGETFNDEQLARQISAGINRQNSAIPTLPAGIFPNQTQNTVEGSPWRSTSLDPSWLHDWASQSVDGAGPSNAARSAGLGRVQMMMRHLASVGETYAQTSIEESAWGLWPLNPSQVVAGGSQVPRSVVGRHPGSTGGLNMNVPRASNDNLANILAMAETVREVLPHVPDELIFQDLQRTNSVTVTVNNLLQM
ncbi:E3 ubiquitin protein ligase RIN2-like [Cucurbita moschata]|uniref:RING-type E3 ubiquitin transferase n=1 Tax=Cucurbita moschata TaxID=3662 RepID=A0A6J1H0A8_CUCMO|nr:E3 ubiquitin protein ligase RIN2-like [Cucurbita moschata]XP_022957822.1 E3 ubiquitin protein ligase RIN2-like [Cucurbita moschata]XP_022957823.1 E3 ubiquitin protein ligase RIN2-like [Cucurbita moschata]